MRQAGQLLLYLVDHPLWPLLGSAACAAIATAYALWLTNRADEDFLVAPSLEQQTRETVIPS